MTIMGLDTSLPSIRQVQNLIQQAVTIEIKLLTGDILIGRIIWQDSQCMCLMNENSQQMTVWKQAIAYIKAKE
ncbi:MULTISPECIES: Hfq-related RNA-binding protein [Brasilonema]|jgi:host factor-I protein|nr:MULTISPECIES: RNA chaperone Hfq [Brasilonema]